MMRKKINYTQVTPIPSYVPRQLAVDLLHSHGEIITLNPLVLNYTPIKAPRDSPADEYYSSWYEVEERVQFIPGVGKIGSGKMKFNGCFHDLPWGLQTHTYAPANVDLRVKYRIAGNQPGEAREPVEMGIGAPPEGLYLREDVEIKCNITMVSFVKKEMKAAGKVLIERLIKKAELLEDGTLQAMMENGRLKTLNPADRATNSTFGPGAPPPSSPRPQSMAVSPSAFQPPQQGFYGDNKALPYIPGQHNSYGGGVQYQQGGFYPTQDGSASQSFPMELPGDAPNMPQHQRQTSMDSKPSAVAPPPSHLHPANRYSTISELSSDTRPSDTRRYSELPAGADSSPRFSEHDSSRPTSYAPTVSDGMRSPRLESGFASVPEEGAGMTHGESLKRLEGAREAHNPHSYGPVPAYHS